MHEEKPIFKDLLRKHNIVLGAVAAQAGVEIRIAYKMEQGEVIHEVYADRLLAALSHLTGQTYTTLRHRIGNVVGQLGWQIRSSPICTLHLEGEGAGYVQKPPTVHRYSKRELMTSLANAAIVDYTYDCEIEWLSA